VTRLDDPRTFRRRTTGLVVGYCLSAAATPCVAADSKSLEQVVVTATPLAGHEVSSAQLPFDVQQATAADLQRQKPLTIAGFMERNFASVTVNEAQSNTFQPDVSFRGFVASPLLGNPIGLSVFVDGVRINESFGDTVQWDLLPTDSLTQLDLLPGANPVFGLNTLGGALSLHTTSGRESPGFGADLMLGSFDRQSVQASVGAVAGATVVRQGRMGVRPVAVRAFVYASRQ
jgi:iron complex outermembrane recepter protein